MATIFKQPVSAKFGKWQFRPGSMTFSHTMPSPSVRNLLWAMGWQSITWFYFELLNQGHWLRKPSLVFLQISQQLASSSSLFSRYYNDVKLSIGQTIHTLMSNNCALGSSTNRQYLQYRLFEVTFSKNGFAFRKKNILCLAMMNNCILIIKILESNKYKLEIVEKIKQWRILLLTTQNLLKNPQYMQRTLMLMAFSSYL